MCYSEKYNQFVIFHEGSKAKSIIYIYFRFKGIIYRLRFLFIIWYEWTRNWIKFIKFRTPNNCE